VEFVLAATLTAFGRDLAQAWLFAGLPYTKLMLCGTEYFENSRNGCVSNIPQHAGVPVVFEGNSGPSNIPYAGDETT
jgi:hypothetical protein